MNTPQNDFDNSLWSDLPLNYANNKPVKNEKITKFSIQLVVLIILIVIWYLITSFDNWVKTWEMIGFVGVTFIFWYWMSALLTKPIEWKNSRYFPLLSSLWYWVILFFIVLGQFNNLFEFNESFSASGLSASVQDSNALLNKTVIKESDNIEKLNEYHIYEDKISDEIKATTLSYKNYMYWDLVFDSYENLEKSVKYHDDLIKYLQDWKGEKIKLLSEKYKEIFWEYMPSSMYDRAYNDETYFENRKIKFYTASKKLYNFYLNNYNLIDFTDWKVKVDSSIYEKYETIYIDYLNEYSSFESYGEEYIK